MMGNAAAEAPLLDVEGLTVSYSLPSRHLLGLSRSFNAVNQVSLSIARGESVGLVGETGCGKSSLSRAICGLTPISAGRVRFNGSDLTSVGKVERTRVRRDLQMIFQDPGGSLNPRLRVGKLIAEPLEIHDIGNRKSRRRRVLDILEAVGLAAGDAERYPHEFSGGQRQRIAIARAVVIKPALILADEPVSALDVSLQAQILNLISALRLKLGLALLFVSHDLNVVRHLCDRVSVMYLGNIVESGPTRAVLDSPRHPYTRELVASSPVPDPDRPIRLLAPSDDPPNPASPPPGCRYHPRCPHASTLCESEVPKPEDLGSHHVAACHHARRLGRTEGMGT
ncbi:MAG: ABC transporter ATP-binding protein [Paracoccaceae bacterium]|nr:ABC transporter ATP-binding protein [Paracoccaceae bacterium]